MTSGGNWEVKTRKVYIRGKTSAVERFRNESESGCDEVSSGEILCRGHGNCCDCGWHCDSGSCSGCHGFGSVIFRNLGCVDRLISPECKRSLPGRNKRTWHWKDNIPTDRAKMAKRARCASNNNRFLTYLPTTKQRKQYPWQSNRYTYLMRAEFGVVQLSNSIGHVFFAHKLYNSSPIPVDVGVANVAGFTHVVLQILPAAALWESWRTKNHHIKHYTLQICVCHFPPTQNLLRLSQETTYKHASFWYLK